MGFRHKIKKLQEKVGTAREVLEARTGLRYNVSHEQQAKGV
jgi:hypothetical protein